MGLSKQSIVVLTTSVGEDLVIRSGPTNDEVRSFVEGAVERFERGLPAGPQGLPAYEVYSARRYDTELGYLLGEDEGREVKISDLLS